MKFSDIIHLGTSNLRFHFRRNLLIMVIMGIIFGLILTANLWLQGVKNSYFTYANYATDGKVIIEATTNLSNIFGGTAPQPITRDAMISDIEAHGGTVLGDASKIGLYGGTVLPAELVDNAIIASLKQTPPDAIPILVPTHIGETFLSRTFPAESRNATRKLADYEEYRDSLIGHTFTDAYSTQYYVVGLAPGDFHTSNLSFQALEKGNQSVFNIILEQISTPRSQLIVIDHQNINNQLNQPTDGATIIATFENSAKAYDYFLHSHGKFLNIELPNRTYLVNTIAGASPETQYLFDNLQHILSIISAALGLIGIIIIIFTSIRLIDQNTPTITLYYRLGANTQQVHAIYLCYLFELMLGAAILAFSLASIIVFLFSVFHQELLSVQALVGFNLDAAPYVVWYGINLHTFIIIAIMLLISGICVLVNHSKLSTRVQAR